MQRQSGITLIALVITIIVLLILAGVSISMVTGDNGIATKAQLAKTETDKANAEEEKELNDTLAYIEENTKTSISETEDENTSDTNNNDNNTTPATTISFTIAGNTFEAIEGMTWENWISSQYNIDPSYPEEPLFYTCDCGSAINILAVDAEGMYAHIVKTSGGTDAISITDPIVANTAYYQNMWKYCN